VKIGDLVAYKYARRPGAPRELGIVVETPQDFFGNYRGQCRVVWVTCDNEGWWDVKNLEVLSGAASS
jgi:hypothetical protein